MDVVNRLASGGIITPDKAAEIEAALAAKPEQSPEFVMSAAGIPDDVLREAFSQEYGVPTFALGQDDTLPEDVLRLIPEESARHYKIVPLKLENGVLEVGVNDPDDLQIKEVLQFISSKHNVTYKFVFMLQKDLTKALSFYDSLSGEVGAALTSLGTSEAAKKAEENLDEAPQNDLAHVKEDAPVTKIVATILRHAVDGGASDIHVEPSREKVVVRFRIDGILTKSLELPSKVHSAVIARIKILASARLDEKRKPQDGRFSANFDGRKIDFRVSILPTNHGEKAVMRILDTDKGIRQLDATGISEHSLAVIRRMIKEPYGIILISGPTGSGKSTTLYTMLSEVDRHTKNVLSLEDPIEYDIDGVSQSQVRPEIGYTFAAGLRSALRQDPDIIMVGEIRDKETAQLAIQAALTGHLVLSTIHTNNSIGVIPRLIDMGVDPYLIAPTLKLAIAQRLALRLCPGTGSEMPVQGALKMMIDDAFTDLPPQYHDRIPQSTTVLSPESTPGCATGTKGRVAVMETLEITDEIQELILKGGSEEEIYKSARKNGFMSLREDAIIKALNHLIPQEEINNFGTKVGQENVLDEMKNSADGIAHAEAAAEAAPPPPTTEPPAVDNPPAGTTIDV